MEIDIKDLSDFTKKADNFSQVKIVILNYILSKINVIADTSAGSVLDKTVDCLIYIMKNSRSTTQRFSLREASRHILFGILPHNEAMEIWEGIVHGLSDKV